MTEEGMLINPEEEQKEVAVPLYSIAAAAYSSDEEGNLDFKFQAVLPKNADVMEWLGFLFLTRKKVDEIYQGELEKAVVAYVELKEEVGMDAARADIESYLFAKISEGYEGDNTLGLRDVEDEEE